MLEVFEELNLSCVELDINMRICFASRPYPNVTTNYAMRLILHSHEGHNEAIAKYTQRRLRNGHLESTSRIRARILDKANGIFM